MQPTYDTGISKRLGYMVFGLIVLLIVFHLSGFSAVSATARVSL
jgi:hypothetical protein